MNPVLRNILGVVAGIVIGSIVNMTIIQYGPLLIPNPEGADFSTKEGLQNSLHLMESKHYIVPWMAHAMGTLVGAFIAALISATQKMRMAYIVGFFFFLGGVAMVVMLAGPLWFTVADLALAYIPMAWMGGMLGSRVNN